MATECISLILYPSAFSSFFWGVWGIPRPGKIYSSSSNSIFYLVLRWMCPALNVKGWITCPNHHCWLLLIPRSSGSTPKVIVMSNFLNPQRLNIATLYRKHTTCPNIDYVSQLSYNKNQNVLSQNIVLISEKEELFWCIQLNTCFVQCLPTGTTLLNVCLNSLWL